MSIQVIPCVVAALLVQSVLITGAAVVFNRALRRRFSGGSTLLLRAACLSLLLLPASTLLFQFTDFDLPALRLPAAASAIPDTFELSSTDPGLARALEQDISRTSGEPTVSSAPTSTVPGLLADAMRALLEAPLQVWLGASCVYGAVVMVLAWRMVRAHVQLRRVCWLARAAEPGLQAKCARIARTFGARAPRLLLSCAVISPAVAGMRPACILLPSAMAEPEGDSLEHVLKHELSHVVRRDFLWQLLAKWAAVIYWFVPTAWMLVRDMEQLDEEAADDAAIGNGGDRIAYARELLAIAECMRSAGLTRQGGLAMAQQPMALRRRIERILDASRRPGTCGGARFGILVPLAAIGIGCMAGFFIAAPATALSEATPGAPAVDSEPISLGFQIQYSETAEPMPKIETTGVMQRKLLVVSPRNVSSNLPDYTDDVLSLLKTKALPSRGDKTESAGVASYKTMLVKYPKRQEMYAQLENEVGEHQRKLDEWTERIEKLRRVQEELPATASAEEKETLKANIDAEYKEYRAALKTSQQEIDASEEKTMRKVVSDISEAAKQIGEHHGLAFLFSDNYLWWHAPGLDCTQAFLAQAKAAVPLCEDSAGRMLKIGVLDTSQTALESEEALLKAVREYGVREGFQLILNGGEEKRKTATVCLYAAPELRGEQGRP